MSKDRVFSSESSSDSEDERPSRPKKTFTTVKLLGKISHKKSPITIFGHKHKIKNIIKNFIKKFYIFHEKNFNSPRFWFIFGIKLRIFESNLH